MQNLVIERACDCRYERPLASCVSVPSHLREIYIAIMQLVR